ncbi:hypothetical protein B0H13DRAFT_2357868 [Mycena leptocephala]|nr:hypothetical protein B0H13DRAFT_2357868 [Mycena leptocephala]
MPSSQQYTATSQLQSLDCTSQQAAGLNGFILIHAFAEERYDNAIQNAVRDVDNGLSDPDSDSITRAVAYNIVGPGLPQALQLLRYPKHNPDGTLWATNKEDPETVATTCLEDHATNIITSEEERRLREDSEMLDTLEDIYSLTQKDRTSKTSVQGHVDFNGAISEVRLTAI